MIILEDFDTSIFELLDCDTLEDALVKLTEVAETVAETVDDAVADFKRQGVITGDVEPVEIYSDPDFAAYKI